MIYRLEIARSLAEAMQDDPKVLIFGEGVTDPKGIFGTTREAAVRFPDRVMETPLSENMITGACLGLALEGWKPVLVHARCDLLMTAMEHMVNTVAQWRHVHRDRSFSFVIRALIGRGWGQGPTHSQNLQAWFAHIPGLKVVMPTTAADAKGLLLSSIFDDNPVVFLEHRWLHNQEGYVPEGDVREPLGKAKLLHKGNDLSIVSMSYMTVEALHAVEHMEPQGIFCDVLDLRTISPLDWEMVFNSVRKTGRLLVLDTSSKTWAVPINFT